MSHRLFPHQSLSYPRLWAVYTWEPLPAVQLMMKLDEEAYRQRKKAALAELLEISVSLEVATSRSFHRHTDGYRVLLAQERHFEGFERNLSKNWAA